MRRTAKSETAARKRAEFIALAKRSGYRVKSTTYDGKPCFVVSHRSLALGRLPGGMYISREIAWTRLQELGETVNLDLA